MLKFNYPFKFSLLSLFLLFPVMLYAAGALDPTFGTNGKAYFSGNNTYSGRQILVQPDDKIIVASVGVPEGGANSQITVTRFNADGSLDAAFSGGGSSSVGSRVDLGDVKLQPDGKIVVVGQIEIGTNSYDYFFARFNTDGSVDRTFGNSGQVVVERPDTKGDLRSLAVQLDGKLVASGGHYNPRNNEIIRLNANGSVDTGFGDNGFFTSAEISYFVGVAVTTDGKIIAAGNIPAQIGLAQGRLLKITQNGSLDSGFGQNGIVTGIFNGVFDMVVQPDDKIVISSFSYLNRFLPNGTSDSFYQHFAAELKLMPNGRFLAFGGGGAVSLLSKTSTLIGRINNLPEPDNPQNAVSFNDAAAQSDGKIIVSLTSYTVGQQSSNRIFLVRYKGVASFASRIADYDFDDKSDIGVYRPSNKTFYLQQSRAGFKFAAAATPVNVVVPENFTGISPITLDYGSDLVWSSADQTYNYFCGNHEINSSLPDKCFQWGLSTDVVVGGDYNGDNKTDLTIFRDGLWHIRRSPDGASLYYNWGQAGDKPVPADYDYDGKTDVATYRPNTGVWWVLKSSDFTYTAVQFGIGEDKPVAADYDGDGHADFAVYRPSTGVWYLLQSAEGFAAAQFGVNTDRPVPGDYDGDGKTDIAVYRASEGNWYLLQSKNGFGVVRWGQNGDVPLSTAYAAE